MLFSRSDSCFLNTRCQLLDLYIDHYLVGRMSDYHVRLRDILNDRRVVPIISSVEQRYQLRLVKLTLSNRE
jgi:hypothetical protein